VAKYLKAGSLQSKIIRADSLFLGNLVGNITGNLVGNSTLPSYTVAQLEDGTTLPAADNLNKIVICSNGDSGSMCLAKSNGTSWLRISIGDSVSIFQTGTSWVQVGFNESIEETFVHSMIEFKGKLYGGTGGHGYLCEWNNLDSWIAVGGPIWVGTGDGVRTMFIYNNELYLISEQGCQLWKWNEIDTLIPIIGDFGAPEAWSSVVYGSNVYLGTGDDGRLLKWDGISSNWVVALPKFGDEEYLGSLLIKDDKLYGSTYPNGLLLEWDFISPTWTQVASSLPAEDVFNLMEYDNEIYAITGEYAESDPGCLIKWNGVDSWIKVAGQFESEAGLHSGLVYDNNIYAGSDVSGLLLKWNKIDSWIKVADTHSGVSIISSLYEFEHKLFGGTGAQAYLYEWR
jgi:hypothetical protein